MAKRHSPAGGAAGNTTDIRDVIDHLSQQVGLLTQAVDALVVELQWRNDQLRDQHNPPSQPFFLHSMSRDPCAKDWQINRVQSPIDEQAEPLKGPKRETLFD